MDKKEEFQRAKDTLQSHDIYLKNTSSFTAEKFEPNSVDWNDYVFQFIHLVRGSEIVGVTDEDGKESQFFKVYVDVGCRFIAKKDQKIEEPKIHAQIEASFCSEYLMLDEDLDEDSLKVFALQNVSYHIWPFWREYLMNMCNRLNLPKVPLPTMQIKPQNGEED